MLQISTRLVQVSVVVQDKTGKPVSGLTKDDFVLTDKGKEQEIRFFSTEANDASDDQAQPFLPEGVYSNRLAAAIDPDRSTAPSTLTVILLDGLNTQFADRSYMSSAVLRVLAHARPGDRIALYALNNGLRVLHDFTAVTPARPESMAELATPELTLADMIKNAQEEPEQFYMKHQAESTLAALEYIAFHLQGFTGRKNLVWISGGFPFSIGWGAKSTGRDYVYFGDQIHRVVREFNQAGIAIYPVDVRGLTGMFEMDPRLAAAAHEDGVFRSRQIFASDTYELMRSREAAMSQLEDQTGGRAFLDSNGLEEAIQTAVNDARFTYLLSYQPTHDQWDGSFREIKIRVKRPGLKARYRPGYLALPSLDETPGSEAARKAALITAGSGPLLSTGLTLQASGGQASAGLAARESQFLQVDFTLDANELSFAGNPAGQREAVVDLTVVLRDAKGKAVSSVTRTMHRTLRDSDSKDPAFIPLTLWVPRAHSATVARLVARDTITGLVGSVDIPLN